MAKKIFTAIFKWILVPVALAFIGYAFIGPHIGRNPPSTLKNLASNGKTVDVANQSSAPVPEPEGAGKEWPEPKVEVELRRLNGNRVQDRQIHKTANPKTTEPKVTEDNAAPATPENTDEPPEEDTVPPSPEEPPEELPEGPG